MFESLYKHTLVGVLPILQYHIYKTYYELRLTYTRLIILILVYSIIQLSLLLRSINFTSCVSLIVYALLVARIRWIYFI